MLAHWGAFIKGESMIMFDIAEWIINLTVLGLGLLFWCASILLIGMIFAISNKWIKQNLIK